MTITTLTIIQKPVGNFWQGRSGQSVVAIVNHITQGGRFGVLARFSNTDPNQSGGQASSHFLVCTDGQIWQFVDTDNAAWANGIMSKPDTSIDWIARCASQGINPNLCTISIEHEGYTGQPLTEAQYQASLTLQRSLIDRYHIPLDRNHLIGHYQIDSINRPFCPGTAYPWTRLMADLAPQQVIAGGSQYFAETDQWLVNSVVDPFTGQPANIGFLNYWQTKGGLAIFGFPLTGAYYSQEYGLIVQWFERARFEYHPDNPAEFKVQLGLLGQETLSRK